MRRPLIYSPIALLFSTMLVILLGIAALVLFLGLISTSFTRIGFTWSDALILLLASWLGSRVNVPIARVRSRVPTFTSGFVRAFGVVYRVPLLVEAQRVTVLAVNVGRAVVPALVSLYLLDSIPRGDSVCGARRPRRRVHHARDRATRTGSWNRHSGVGTAYRSSAHLDDLRGGIRRACGRPLRHCVREWHTRDADRRRPPEPELHL